MREETVGGMVLPMHDVDLATGVDEFERRLEAALAARPRALVLDMAAVERVSSTTVAMLLWARRRCVAHGVDLVLARPSRRCRDVLDRTGLLDLVTTASPR